MRQYKLDTIGQIYSYTTNSNWSPVYRIQANLFEAVDPSCLQKALDDLRERFPYFFVAMKKGFCSNYFEENDEQLKVMPDGENKLTYFDREEFNHFCFRILYGEKHVAIEIFHVLTDGHGASVFLFTLLHRYLELKHGIPKIAQAPSGLIYSLEGKPSEEETENSYKENAGNTTTNLKEEKNFKLGGTPIQKKIVTLGIVDTKPLLDKARHLGVTVTTFLTTVLIETLIGMQNKEGKTKKRPVTVSTAANIRNVFASKTLRNYTATRNLGVAREHFNDRFEDKCKEIGKQLKEFTQKDFMQGVSTAYVKALENPIIKYMPLTLKEKIVSAIYTRECDDCTCVGISNLGDIKLPEEMAPFIDRMYFVLGDEKTIRNNCSAISFNGKTYIAFTRSIEETALEDMYFERLNALGLEYRLESL